MTVREQQRRRMKHENRECEMGRHDKRNANTLSHACTRSLYATQGKMCQKNVRATRSVCTDLENAPHKAYPHPRRRDGGVRDGHSHRATPPDLEKTPRIHVCLSLFRRTGGSKTSRSGKLHATWRVEKARSLQDRSTCRSVRRPLTTNEFTLFLSVETFDGVPQSK